MIGDRLSDTLMVLLLLLLCLVVAAPALEAFLVKYPIGNDIMNLLGQWWFWLAAVGGLALCSLIVYLFRNTRIIHENKRDGVEYVERVRRGGNHAGTLGILRVYTLYMGMLLFAAVCGILCLRLHTRTLHPAGQFRRVDSLPCSLCTQFNQYGNTIERRSWSVEPRNHVRTRHLWCHGCPGTAFSMLQWSGQTVMLIILGIYTMIYTFRSKPTNSNHAI